jgi:hypothetical protein
MIRNRELLTFLAGCRIPSRQFESWREECERKRVIAALIGDRLPRRSETTVT